MTDASAFVAAAVGLAFEARIAQRGDGVVTCVGRGAALADRLAAAAGQGCRGIVSFGIAGGLDPRLRPGTVVVASAIVHATGSWRTDEAWIAYLLARLGSATRAPILGVDQPVVDAAEKAAWFHRAGAAAVDMESHIAAAAAEKMGLPFAALRIIADPAKRAVPDSALAGMRPDGTTDAVAAFRALSRRPSETVSLARLARDTWDARRRLVDARRRLGAGFGLLDLA
jgi:hopanoid-associated phosphorylase